ncbi:hypothetical protein [Bosea sp. Root381]|uniref:hypothetical protein n=1 Tax=Bosea sp. Root381 TaxID=1736524 RepID=UPI0012E3A437|nr:hypothetical protein [Bosea sp. Root381]
MTDVAKSPIASSIAVVQPDFGGGVASAQTIMLNATDTLSATPNIIPLTSSYAPMSSFAVSQTDEQQWASRPSRNFPLTGSGE